MKAFLKNLFRKKSVYTFHQVVDMDETMIQRCVICGEIIQDYTKSRFLGPKPKGFPAGGVWVSNGEPKIITSVLGSGEADEIQDCRP